MQFPTDQHLAIAKRILRYVRGTLTTSLQFNPGPLSLFAFTNVDWAGDPSDRRSTTGYLVFLGSSPISYSTKKQYTIFRSSTKVEY